MELPNPRICHDTPHETYQAKVVFGMGGAKQDSGFTIRNRIHGRELETDEPRSLSLPADDSISRAD